ncbi:hypothetical protein M527_19075 [Sphingobium indicum IP26]|nr:hypothetical protein M527_24230 [Sphingobium indicum IP26]EPR16882.1 hypothetical protein M527_19075 [Sphingobium indicum IP26]
MIQQRPKPSGRSLAGSAASSRTAMRGLRPLTSGRRWRGGADFWASLDAGLVGAPC